MAENPPLRRWGNPHYLYISGGTARKDEGEWRMTMEGEIERDKVAAQSVAIDVAAYLQEKLSAGCDPSLLALACLGCGTDLLCRAQSPESAAKALADVVAEIVGTDADPKRVSH
jgi:hypothetical protein